MSLTGIQSRKLRTYRSQGVIHCFLGVQAQTLPRTTINQCSTNVLWLKGSHLVDLLSSVPVIIQSDAEKVTRILQVISMWQ